MTGNFRGARAPTGESAISVTALTDQLFHAFGQELIQLQRTNDDDRIIAVKVEVGSFRVKVGVGDTDDDLAAPTESDVVAGAGSLQLIPGDGILYFSRNEHMSLQGEGASDICTFWYLP